MKKICVVTGSRADYGLLKGVMENLRESQVCDLQIIATGMHLTSEFGSTDLSTARRDHSDLENWLKI